MGLILDQIVEGIECTSQYVSRRSDRSGVLAYPYFADFIYCFYITTYSFIFSNFFLMIFAEDRKGKSTG